LEKLYKVLFVFCLIFLVVGVIYVLYFLPEVPSQQNPHQQSLMGDMLVRLSM
jgi:hypothetical protein